MEIGELIHVVLSAVFSDRCPFCNDPEDTEQYTTWEGGENNSGKLREIMNDPRCLVRKQSGARPKNGGRRQDPDDPIPSPDPIFRDDVTVYPELTGGPVGIYGDEAHHAISGNECMDGEPIEDVIKNLDGEYEGETGYSINNAANGVYLPSWSRRSGRWGATAPDGAWGRLGDNTKYEIMKRAMRAGVGQAHIGSHSDKVTAKHPRSYPEYVQGQLEAITSRVIKMSANCPYCKEGGAAKSPLPVPYGVNLWLDVLSKRIAAHLRSHPRSWRYFVSQYAADYHDEVCRHKTVAQALPDNWPPL